MSQEKNILFPPPVVIQIWEAGGYFYAMTPTAGKPYSYSPANLCQVRKEAREGHFPESWLISADELAEIERKEGEHAEVMRLAIEGLDHLEPEEFDAAFCRLHDIPQPDPDARSQSMQQAMAAAKRKGIVQRAEDAVEKFTQLEPVQPKNTGNANGCMDAQDCTKNALDGRCSDCDIFTQEAFDHRVGFHPPKEEYSAPVIKVLSLRREWRLLGLVITLAETAEGLQYECREVEPGAFKHRGAGLLFRASNGAVIESVHPSYKDDEWPRDAIIQLPGVGEKPWLGATQPFGTYAQALDEFEAWLNWPVDWDSVPKGTPCEVQVGDTWQKAAFGLYDKEMLRSAKFFCCANGIYGWCSSCRLLIDRIKGERLGIKYLKPGDK